MKKSYTIILTLVLGFLFNGKLQAQWIQMGGINLGQTDAFAISDTTLIAGTFGRGVFLSTNNGKSWSAINNGLTNFYINALAIYDTTIFAGTNDGVFLSSDRGKSWIKSNLGGIQVNCFLVADTNVFAGTLKYGVQRWYNKNKIWKGTSSGMYYQGSTNYNVWALCVDKDNDIFAGTGGGVYRSTDNGKNWGYYSYGADNDQILSFAVSANYIFAGTNYTGIFRLNNNGWYKVIGGLNGPADYTCMIAWDTNILAGTGWYGPIFSKNDGLSWEMDYAGLNITGSLRFYALAISDTNIFAGTKAGVFRADTNDLSWTAVNNNATNLIVNSFAVSDTNLFAAIDHNGIFRSNDNGMSWISVNSGLPSIQRNGWRLVVSDTNLYALTQNGVYLSTNNGTSWTAINQGMNNIKVYCLVASDTTLFAGTTHGLFLSTNNGKSWTNGGLIIQINCLAVSGTDVFIGTSKYGILKSNDHGISEINNGLTNANVTAFAVSGKNIFAGTDGGGVFLSTNNGNKWTPINNGLTNAHVTAFEVSGSKIFVVTTGGVFVSTNNGSSWASVNTLMMNSNVQSLLVSGKNLFAGTSGNGIWRLPLTEITGIKELHTNLNLQVYPNPATDNIIVDIKNSSTPALIELIDLDGQIVYSKKIMNKKRIFVGNLPNGIYLCKVTINGKTETIKIMKN